MGKSKRQFHAHMERFTHPVRQAVRETLSLLPLGVDEDSCIRKFCYIYPHLWDEIKQEYRYWHGQNCYLVRRGKKFRYAFPAPRRLVLKLFAQNQKVKGIRREKLSSEEREKREQLLRIDSLNKQRKKQRKKREACRYKQEIEPSYAGKLISTFHRIRDLQVQTNIANALSHFISPAIIRFFYRINACHPNFSLKLLSMHYIQALGLPFKLRKKRKGKKKKSVHMILEPERNPACLLNHLAAQSIETLMKFDVFISHSSADEEMLIPLFRRLNQAGMVAYIDWVNDRERLPREACCAETAAVLGARIRQSRLFLFVVSDESLRSTWCAWELGFAAAIGMPIYLYYDEQDASAPLPEYLRAYSVIDLSDWGLNVETGGNLHSSERVSCGRMAES